MSTEGTRPTLLPQNRKLRHLRGIYFRNLSFVRPRGRTIDDAAINKSPEKLETLRESQQLHHAHSTENLRLVQARQPLERRRSSTLSKASPFTRQKRLECALESRIADAFFSLHIEGEDEPVYISEVAERATNFDFRFFELSDLSPSVTRLSHVVVKLWAKRSDKWTLLIEERADLRCLNFLGSLRNVHFPPNSLVFHLSDGVYSLELSGKYPPPKQANPLPTASYNALMRLATLDNSIRDAIATRETIAKQINEILARTPTSGVPEANDKLVLANRYLAQQRRAVAAAKRRKAELLGSISSRRRAIRAGRSVQENAAADVEDATGKLGSSKELLQSTKESIRGQRRRICEDLTRIYSIGPIPEGPPLGFQICGITLPNTNYTELPGSLPSEDAVSAALGYAAQLTNALQFYLGVPLPYPITPLGSRSSIRDDISALADPQRQFPLYIPRGGSKAQFRFDYGWFLLNKDIEVLCAAQGLKVVDIRHTLPNLKYLLYVCCAGTDEMPERKRGGVRGLWAGRLKGRNPGADDRSSPESREGSRRSSADSDLLSRQRDELRKAIRDHSRASNSPAAPPSPAPSPSVQLPFGDGEAQLTLRTKGLREDVVR